MKSKPKAKKKKIDPKAPPEALRTLISQDVYRYLNVLGLKQYKPKVLYMMEEREVNHDDPGHSHGVVAASAEVDKRYLTVHVRVFPWLVDGWVAKRVSDEEVSEIIAHEISHVATDHMYTLATSVYKDHGEMGDAWESLTTIIGRLVFEVDKRRRNFVKKDEVKKKTK
jgi:hypothetical protein